MREPSTEQLEQDRNWLDAGEHWCDYLVNLISDDALELELSKYKRKTAISVLGHISDALHHRIGQISEQLEARSNQAFDRFVQKQRKQ